MPAPYIYIIIKAVRLLSLPISLPAFIYKDHPNLLINIYIYYNISDQHNSIIAQPIRHCNEYLVYLSVMLINAIGSELI